MAMYRTMRGKPIDLDSLRIKNELTPAVGNAKVNARGDQLGPGGKIVRTREEVLKDYYAEAPSMPNENAKTIKKQSTPVEESNNDDNWVEDDEGNFVQKKSTRTKSK